MAGSKLVDAGFLAGNSSSKSFRDALSGSFSSFPDLKISTHRGMPSMWISEAEVLSLALPFEFSLVGKFPSNRPSLEAIRKFFFNLKLNGYFFVTVLNTKNVLIKLANDLDYYRVFAHRSYFINNCYMRLIKWSPSFDVDVESPVVPIWVSFSNLRPHLFSPRILQGLGSIFGRPLKIDQATSVGSRPFVARILVELDVSKQHPDKVWVGPNNLGYVQSVVLENVPSYCLHCKALGHSNADCLVLHPHLAPVDIVPESVVEPVVVPLVPEVVAIDSAVQVPMGSNVQLDEVLWLRVLRLMFSMTISWLVFMISVGFNAAASVRVSNELGAGNPKSAAFSVYVVTIISFIISLVIVAIILYTRDYISYIFTEGETVARAVSDLCPLLAVTIVLNGIQPVLSGVAVGCGWQAFVAYVNVGCFYFVGIPAGILLGFDFGLGLGAKGIWSGMIGGTFIQTLILLWVTFRTNWSNEVEKAQKRLEAWDDKRKPLLADQR
ncbi:hypothetical protein M5K25_019472 [Dendrobium thyrsiflorum]|uniref:Protein DETOXIFICATION n=1 Tax=Dendrobium thyrsiflorum TaxID=117978 RepID=A0ABD0UM48_DENTH